jgi:hypothetical protein
MGEIRRRKHGEIKGTIAPDYVDWPERGMNGQAFLSINFFDRITENFKSNHSFSL